MEKLTETEMFFEIELDDKKSLCHKPGQFVEVSIFGIGEAPTWHDHNLQQDKKTISPYLL